MGEVTQETRIYALPFLSSPIALSTQLGYDSWGRVDSIVYPDGEIVKYGYDCGGQLQRMYNEQCTMNNGCSMDYIYLDNVAYDRFGAKVSQEYGNGLVTNYAYDNLTRRLLTITTLNSNSRLSSFAYTYDNAGNVTQVTSTCPWLNSRSLTESFTYDASDQLTSATETNSSSYQLVVSYGNWGKINSYNLTQADLQNNITQFEAQAYTYPMTNNTGNIQTMFAPEQRTITDISNNVATETLSFGINGSLRKREVQAQPQASYREYYLFNSAANLKAYSVNGLDFAYYGYNATNTRTYKLSMLNQNQWVNGMPDPIHLQLQSAVFYPNAYLNFNHNGEYTKHYYNGTERIASRLGGNSVSISTNTSDRLGFRIMQVDQQARADLLEAVEAGDVPIETPSMDVTALHPAAADIYYYHSDHLGNTAYVTDNNATITQGFLYAPFGEITTEYAPLWLNGTLPKYAFNAKELDEETGMYYYEARYYKPPTFISRDPLFEKYAWISPYTYCGNNPTNRVDPSGMEMNPIYDNDGSFLGTDDKGLKGRAIVMKKTDFKQNMSHEEAMRHSLGEKGLSSADAKSKLLLHYSGLKNRPDYDGYLTLKEANEWYKNGSGEPLFVDLKKIDLSGFRSLGESKVGGRYSFNLLLTSGSKDDRLVYGNMTFIRTSNDGVRAFADKYDFDMKTWSNPCNWGRNIETAIGKFYAGEGIPFNIYFYGTVTLKQSLFAR